MLAKIYENTKLIFSARIISSLLSLTIGILLAIQFSIEGISFSIAASACIAVVFLGIKINRMQNAQA